MTPFRVWLFQQVDRDDPVGDVARDVKADPWFQQPRLPRAIEAYISSVGCSGAVAVLQRALSEWRERAK